MPDGEHFGKRGNWETKKEYPAAKNQGKKTVYQVNRAVERNRFAEVPQRDK